MAAALAASCVAGCAVGPDFQQPPAPAVAGYTAKALTGADSGGASQAFQAGADVSGAWWRLFGSRQIDALVDEAIRNHPDLEAAQAALRQAREVVAADTGALYPSITANGGLSPQRTSAASVGQPSTASVFTLYGTAVPVTYTPDLFGRLARGIEADTANAEYARFELEATYLTLTSNVVSAAINDASYAAQIAVTQELIDSQRRVVGLLTEQSNVGSVSRADVLSQQAQLAQTEASLPPLQKARAIGRDQLMAYVGRLPSEDRGEFVSLGSLQLPKNLPVTVPSQLVRQRPDIRAAEGLLHQASANVGVATANMLPQLTLSASAGNQAVSLAKFFASQFSVWSAAATLATPVFDAGTLYHTKEEKVAAFEQASAKYRSTVIYAFQNVADSLQAIKADSALLNAEIAAEKAADDSLKIAQGQYKSGIASFQNVLTAEQTLIAAKTGRVKAEAARYADTIALFQALGGGWWNRIDETAAFQAKDPGVVGLFAPLGALAPSGDAKVQ
jgi:NodT family efflux transporter outer membrane factor (OMF) lipoprotein